MAHNFKNLQIWQRSMELTDLAFEYCNGLPNSERNNLIQQINRCSCSVHPSIAEETGKINKVLSTSLSSAFELAPQLLICQRRKYVQQELLNKLLTEITEAQKMIFSFRENIPDGK